MIRSRKTGSARTSVASGAIRTLTAMCSCWRRNRSTDSVTVSARSSVCGRARSEPAWILDMSSRLAIRAFNRSVSPSIASSASRRSTAVVPGASSSRSVTDALIAASGLRRSCETAASSERRTLSVCR